MNIEPMQAIQSNNIVEAGEIFNTRRYFYLLWHRLWLVLLAGVVAGAAGYFFSQRMTPKYETSTKLLVIEAAANRPTDYNTVMANQSLTSTYADLLTNEAVLQEVIVRLGLPTTPVKLAKLIEVSPVRDTQLIAITVQGASPAQIASIANTLVAIFIERIQSIQSDRYTTSKQNLADQLKGIETTLQDTRDKIIAAGDAVERDRLEAQLVQYQQIYATLLTNYEQARLAEAQSTANVVQINLAQPPQIPISPKVLQNSLLAALLACVLMTAVILMLDVLDDTIKTSEQVSQILGLPVLGVIFAHKNGELPITQDQPRSPVSEAFRSLRTNVQYANVDAPLHTLVVTSPSPSEGKTMVSTNLAVVMAQDGRKVILMDADLRRPAMHKRMNVANTAGLTALLLKPEMDLNLVLHKTKTEGLSTLTAGDLPPNPAELLGSRKMGLVMDQLKQRADILVLDTPPVLPVADAAVLAAMMEGVLLVLQPGTTTIAAAKQAVDQLRRVNARIIGVVMNNVELKSFRNNYYYQKEYHYFHEDETPKGISAILTYFQKLPKKEGKRI
jgi:capsular exopolysaccharide synthesis family protein